MFTTVRSRVGAITGLLVLVLGLTVWYGSLGPAPAVGAYPDQDDLAADYDRYLGERVEFGGRVVDTNPVTVAAEYDAGKTLRLTVTDIQQPPTEGDILRVYGVVEHDRTIRAVNAFTVSEQGHWYAWSVSFLAGLLVIGRLGRYWIIDTANWTLNPRKQSQTEPLVDQVRTHVHRIRE